MSASPPTARVPHEHSVQFYEDSGALLDRVSGFLGDGLAAGSAAVVIATERHRRGLDAQLQARGVDLAAARVEGRYRSLDAAETLSQLMVGAMPDERRFHEVVGSAVADVLAQGRAPRAHLFGEMVALLCSEGNPEGAIRLEQLWNELGRQHPFALLCGYPIGGFESQDHNQSFLQICSQHSQVIPCESFTSLTGADDQARVIAGLQQKANALEAEVALRRDTERALLAREKELAELDRRKDEFLAMLGHELRNPMSPIVTALHLVRRRPNDPELLTRSLEVVERNFQRVTRLVDDLLDVSRITSGKIDLREETVALAAIVERAVEQSRPTLEERGHRLTLQLPDEPVSLRADPARLEQVVVNLLINAAKYTDLGGRIGLTVEREPGEVLIRVRDNGMGMTPVLREQVFELFVQGPYPSAYSSGGLGVGLTLVRRLVELHQGSVEAVSDGPGLGSEFVVRLPIRALESQPGITSGDTQVPQTAKRILVVDDNLEAAEGLAEYLRTSGHEVRTAQDGPAAIAEAGRMHPDVILLDIGMPGMDGHEVARHLRANANGHPSVLVALTGYGQESDRRLALEAGFDHHLVKPVDIRKLESLLGPSA